jgi:PAS domain S-box-containing protein
MFRVATRKKVFEGAIELGRIGLAELDATGHFVEVNPGFSAMLGLSEADLIGRHWRVAVPPDDHARVEEAYAETRHGGRAYIEIRAKRADAKIAYHAVTITALRDKEEQLTGYFCFCIDITDYKREQEALMLAVESSPNGLLMLNAEGRIQFANLAVEKLLGYTRKELMGTSVELLIPDRFREGHIRDAFQAGRSTTALAGRDLCGLRKDGVEIPLQIYLNRIETDSGDLVLATIVDIAERVRYETQLELAKVAAEQANRAKSDFLARMSHEIRTPMNLIMGMSALLLESPLSGKQREYIEISYRNVRRLLRLINGILDLSKVEAGKLSLEMVPFDLTVVLQECAGTISAAMEAKGLEFGLTIAPDAWRYWIGDAERLHQILLNLIGNAVKFTARGRIDVDAYREPGEHGESGLRFEVSDTGCGVPPDKVDMIFEAFQQAEGSVSRPYAGTGLGLAITKSLVEKMSGRIWVESRETGGSKFIFTVFFLRSTAQAVQNHKTPHAANPQTEVEHGTRILLTEDNPENVVLVQAYLGNLPLTLDLASNGLQAVEMRKDNAYDMILMDIQMPVMDGLTATREIRAWEKSQIAPRVPIVALTAHALTGARSESLEAGCDGHLTKPVERADLVEAIVQFAKRSVKAENVKSDNNSAPPLAIANRRPSFLANRRLDLQKIREAWRRKRDSNPRTSHPVNGFQDRRLQPLGHSSVSIYRSLSSSPARSSSSRGARIFTARTCICGPSS